MAGFEAEVVREVNEDFDAIWLAYSPHRCIESPGAARANLKVIHRTAFCLSAIAMAVPHSRREHERVFLHELGSDSVRMLHALLCGDVRAAVFYLRSSIENFWRHIYFKDHPVEYSWLSSKPAWYLSLDDLRTYAPDAPAFSQRFKSDLASLTDAYKRSSRIVHSSVVHTMDLTQQLIQIKAKTVQVQKLAQSVRREGRTLLLLLLVVHQDCFAKVHPRQQRYLLEFLDVPKRRAFQAAIQ